MRKLKLLIGVGLIGLSIGAAALAQSIIQQNLNGTDVVLVQAGGPGGPGYPTTVQALRNAYGHTLVATGTTVTTSMSNATAVAIAQGAITTWTVTLPASPFTGEWAEITCPGGSVTTLTIQAASTPAGTVLVGTNPTSCTSGGAASNNSTWTYSTSANTWYRIN